MAVVRRSRFLPDPDLPEVGQAVSLTLAILRTARVTSLAELDGVIPGKVDLAEGQLGLLNRHLPVLAHVRNKGVSRDHREVETVTIFLCPECGNWQLVSGSSGPSKCQLTLSCAGIPLRIPAAKLARPQQG